MIFSAPTALLILWPDVVADPIPILFLAIFLMLGGLAAIRTPIDTRLVRGERLARARKQFTAIFVGYAAMLIFMTVGSDWNAMTILIFGVIGIFAGGFIAGMTLSYAEDGAREERERMPPPVPLDLRAFKIDRLEVTNPPFTTEPHAGLRLYRPVDKNVLALPRGSVATNILKHSGQTIAKIVAPDRSEHNTMRGRRVALLGLDTTGQPFLLELPPEYADRSIDECERWLLQAGEEDEIITS